MSDPAPHFDPTWFRFEGKGALVTGAGGGIGRALCLGLARSGARVLAADVDSASVEATAALVRADGGECDWVILDVRDEAAADAAVAQSVERYGSLDVLMNNAGIQVRKPLLEATPEELRRLVDVNLHGVVTCARAAGRAMITAGGGRIVNTASISAVHGMITRVVYSATKGGVAAFTRALAMEWAPHGITVNAIGPGIIVTPMLAAYLASDEARHRKALETIPLGRVGYPVDVVGAALFLASDAAAYITGQVLNVDGGLTAGDTWW